MTPTIRVTETVHGKESTEGLMQGVKTLHDPVASTLGASGRTVIIEDLNGNPKPTKDGVTVAKAIVPLDAVERMGSEIIKQASLNTANEAGDGTTTATVLARAIFEEGLKMMDNKQTNYTDFNRGMSSAVEMITSVLGENSREVNLDSIEAVATISANNDSELGGKIAEAFKKAGEYGVVVMERSQTNETYVSVTEGFELEKGFRSDVFINVKESSRVEYKDALVLLSTVKIERVNQIEPQLEYAMTNGLPLVIVADMDEDLVAMLAYNVAKTKKLQAVVIPPSHFGVRRRDIMNDLAVYTGATLIDEETGDNFETVTFECLGTAAKVIADRSKTIFLGEPSDLVANQIEVLKKQMENEKSEVEKKFLEERLAKISSSVAVINVGANSEAEVSEIADRVDDAIHATRAALAEGIVAGGGVALFQAAREVSTFEFDNPAIQAGFKCVLDACTAPLQMILSNGDVLADNFDFEKQDFGINVKTGEQGNMFDMNIIDPVKVTKTALKNGVSAASTLLSTTSVVVNLRRA